MITSAVKKLSYVSFKQLPRKGDVGGTAPRILNLAYMEMSSQLRDRSDRFTTRLDRKPSGRKGKPKHCSDVSAGRPDC